MVEDEDLSILLHQEKPAGSIIRVHDGHDPRKCGNLLEVDSAGSGSKRKKNEENNSNSFC